MPGGPQKLCSKAAAPTPPKRRNSILWSETLDIHQKGTFSTQEIKRQEVRINIMTEKTASGSKVDLGGGVSVECENSGDFNLCARRALHVRVEFDSNSLNGAESQPGVISQVV